MSNLNKFLQKKVEQIPRLFLIKKLREKLDKMGINNEEFCGALADHILSGAKGTFHFDDGSEDEVRLDLKFSKDDIASTIQNIEKLVVSRSWWKFEGGVISG